MSRVYVVVEGQTEQALVRDLLAASLGHIAVYLTAVLVGEPGHKAGIRRFAAVERDISKLLRQETSVYVTTLFDRCGLPQDWPGIEESNRAGSLRTAHDTICAAMARRIQEVMGAQFRTERFLPYIQFHEIEAFLFASPSETARILGTQANNDDLQAIINSHETCEHINDGVTTSPAKRIKSIFPNYRKGSGISAHLPRICTEAGLPVLRDRCPLFNRWIASLESLASRQSEPMRP